MTLQKIKRNLGHEDCVILLVYRASKVQRFRFEVGIKLALIVYRLFVFI